MEDKTLEQMLKDFSRERANKKSKVLTTVIPTGSATHPNTMRMKISMKSILRKRSIEKIYA